MMHVHMCDSMRVRCTPLVVSPEPLPYAEWPRPDEIRRRHTNESAMLLVNRAALLCPLLLLPPRSPELRCAPSFMGAVPEAGGDELLIAAMESLRARDKVKAQQQLGEAVEAYSLQPDGPTEDQRQLLELVSSRVDAAVMPGFGRAEAKRPPPPTEAELKQRAEAKARGERALMNTVEVFGDKSDNERFGKSLALLEEARASFRRAGAEVERERDGVLGNLYAVIRAEEERSQRVQKLVRMKKLLELTKQKRKAETLGIDADEFEESIAPAQPAPSPPPTQPAPAPSNTADDILAAWKEEGLDSEAQDVDDLARRIDELEDTL